MFDKKIELEDIKGAETVVGASVKLKGTLKSDGNVTINGSVSGEIQTKADVFIGGSAELKANISAKNAIIAGIIQGNIKVEGELKITETGKVFGDLQAKVLNITPGAVFSGKSVMLDKEEAADSFKEIEKEATLENTPVELEA